MKIFTQIIRNYLVMESHVTQHIQTTCSWCHGNVIPITLNLNNTCACTTTLNLYLVDQQLRMCIHILSMLILETCISTTKRK